MSGHEEGDCSRQSERHNAIAEHKCNRLAQGYYSMAVLVGLEYPQPRVISLRPYHYATDPFWLQNATGATFTYSNLKLLVYLSQLKCQIW